MSFPGKLYCEQGTLKIETSSAAPRIFFVEHSGFHSFIQQDAAQWLDVLASSGVNGVRVSGFWPFGKGHEEEPFAKTETGYDLHTLNESYFTHLQEWVAYAAAKGCVVIFDLFDAWGILKPNIAPYHPFYPLTGRSLLRFTNLQNPFLWNSQKQYVQRVVEALLPYQNVILGIMNQFTGHAQWHYDMSTYVRSLAPNHLIAGSKEDSSALSDPLVDIWLVQTGSYDFETGRPHVAEDVNALRQTVGGQKIIGFSTSGFGEPGKAFENPTDMRRLAQDAVNAGIQLFGFLDHQAYDVVGEGRIERLNTQTYHAISETFQPTFFEASSAEMSGRIINPAAVRPPVTPGNAAFEEELNKYTDRLDVFSVSALPSNHPQSIVEHGGKAIPSNLKQGFLCFGQYRTGYPTSALRAIFSILIDNNSADDNYILILDVYDHQSDRVIGKRLITRKDFDKANEFCMFTMDFTPPSVEANLEFRIYYMGHAYVLADKIGVVHQKNVVRTRR